MDKALRDLIDHIQFIENVAAKIHGVLDEAEIFRIVTEEFVQIERSMAGILLLDEDGSSLKVAEVSLSSDIVKTLENLADSGIEEFRTELNRSNSLTQVIKDGQTLQVTSRDISEAILPEPLASQVMDIMELGKELSIVTPIRRRGEVIGLLMVMAPRLAEYFIPSVKNLARHISTALELADEHAERERIEAALRNSEEYFRCLIENAPDMIGVLDADGSIRYVSPSVEQITGYKAEEILGGNSFDFVHPNDLDRAVILFSEGIREGHSSSMEVRFQHKDDSWRYAEFKAMYLLDNPSVNGVVLNCRDITERKAAEDALHQSEGKFRAIVENAPDQFVMVEPNGTISFINFIEPGFELETVIGTSVYDYVAPELADLYRQTQDKAFRTGQPERIEVLNITDRIHDCRLIPLGEGGQVDQVMVILTDITDRKQAEEDLRQSETRYRQLFDSAPDGVFILDRDGIIVECSHNTMLLYGYSREEMINNPITSFMHASSKSSFSTQTEPFEGEIRIIRSDGSTTHIWRKGVPLKDADGNLTGVLLYDRDITDRKRADDLLQRHRERLENVVKERTSSLEDANTALRVMLKTGDQVKAEVRDNVLFNVKRFALPYLDELKKSALDGRQKAYVDMLEQSLNAITEPFLHGVPVQSLTLTPTEITVTDLIKQGKTTKEIAGLLNMSERTVETHRYNIRHKLGLKNTTVNLRTYISSLDNLVD